MKHIFVETLKIFLIKNKGFIILTTAAIFSISLFSFQLYSYQAGLSDDELYYNEYIDRFSGKLTDKKIKEIELINTDFQKNEYFTLIEKYQNGQLSEKQYIDKQNQLNKKLKKETGFNLFYKQYLSVKSNPNLQICNSKFTSFLTMCDFDYIQLFIVLFMIYAIFLKDYDNNTIIYEKITSGGKKYSHRSKMLVFSIFISVFIIFTNVIKILEINHYINLNFSIYNINWVSKETINITLLQFYIISIILIIIGSWLLATIAIIFNHLFKKASFILILLFILCYILKGFFGNDPLLLYLPFVSFFIPGKYFAGIGDTMMAFDINILFIILILTFLFITLTLFKPKKLFLLTLCLFLFSGCKKNTIYLRETYNSYQNINFSETDKYLYFNQQLFEKENLSAYSLYRDPLEMNDFLENIFVFNDHIIYVAGNDNDKVLYNLDLEEFIIEKIDNLSQKKKNYLNINEEHNILNLDSVDVKILGNKDSYIYVYNNRITDKNGNILIQGDFSRVISLYDNCIYSLQSNNQIMKYSLTTKTKELIDTVLCDYFFIKKDKIYCHSIKDNKIYEKRTLVCDIPVNNFDIYNNTVYYNTDQGIFSYDLINKTNFQIATEKGYSIKVSDDGKYLYYICDAKTANKTISLNIMDLANYNLLKSIED
ncbi:hypothetical protein [Thomasclavelia cocleata]|uniref:hypothetical protein n=3 Tax=Thomasclavelia cocleata TaxID=69824 RepID=UPI002430C360|nr:hypothetical protein [Thomasclavelia cocleata]